MAANHSSARRAAPCLTLLLQKCFQAKFLDAVEVVYHAHMVFGTVALIQCLQSPAGEAFAFKTKPDAAFSQQFAGVPHMCAVFTPGKASRTMFFVKTPFVYAILPELISAAQTAVHPARGDQFCIHGYAPSAQLASVLLHQPGKVMKGILAGL